MTTNEFRQEVCIQLARKMSDHLRIFGLVNDDTGQDVFNCLADHFLKTPDNLLMEYLGIAKPVNMGENR